MDLIVYSSRFCLVHVFFHHLVPLKEKSMKRTLFAGSTILACALLLAGCGKSEAEKAAESELNAKIMKAHEDQMAMAGQLDALLTKVEAAIAEHDSLAKVFPKQMADKSSADLISSKDKLSAAKDGMESWMSSHEPYNPGIKHDLAMQQLTQDLDLVTQVGKQMTDAMDAARTALDMHSKGVAELATPAKAKKK